MNRSEALEVLGLPESCSSSDVDVLCQKFLVELEARISSALVDDEREKYERIKGEIEQAQEVLLVSSATVSLAATANGRGKVIDVPEALSRRQSNPKKPIKAGRSLGIQVGHVMSDRYEIRAPLCERRLSSVYQAYDRKLGKEVAIKVLFPRLLAASDDRECFLNEVGMLRRLSHKHMVDVLDVGCDGAFYFVVMEWLHGETLRDAMDAHKQAHRHFSLQEVQKVIRAVADALIDLHHHTLLRDLKPEHVFITETGEIKLMVCGIARLIHTSQRTQMSASIKAAYYMPPEQMSDEEAMDARADQYALAVMVYEMLTGTVPVGRMLPLLKQRKDIGDGFSKAINKALSPQPEERYANLSLLTTALLEEENRRGIGGRSLIITAAAVLCLLLLMLSGWWYKSRDVLPQVSYAQTLQMEGKVESLKMRFEELRRSQERTVREAKSNVRQREHLLRMQGEVNDAQKNALAASRAELLYQQTVQQWQQRIEEEPSLYSELNGKNKWAAALNRDARHQESMALFEELEAAYSILLGSIRQVPSAVTIKIQVDVLWQSWQRWAAENQYTDHRAYIDVEKRYNEALLLIKKNDFSAAAMLFHALHIEIKNLQSLAPSVMEDRARALAKEAQWEAYARGQKINNFPGEMKALDTYKVAEQRYSAGHLKEAGLLYKHLQQRYAELLSKAKNIESITPKMVVIEGSRGRFEMGRYEVTQAQWLAVMSDNPSKFKGDSRPVENVSWDEVQIYIQKLNTLTGKIFRLPTEAEWDYSARAGAKTRYSWGNEIGLNRANCDGCGSLWDDRMTAPVGSFAANALGVYDMHGNVWEWVQDCWRGYAQATHEITRESTMCEKRVMRGGSWVNRPKRLSSSYRVGNPSSARYLNTGFRLARH